MLNYAKVNLSKAQDEHFKLESIYTSYTDFEIIDKITDSLINEIKIIINH
jgi:hypothetical protein